MAKLRNASTGIAQGQTMNIQIFGNLLFLVAIFGHVICFFIALVNLYRRDQTLAVLFFVLNLACGLGTLVTFVYAWTKAGKWNLKPVMWVWTVFLAMLILLFSLDGYFHILSGQEETKQSLVT
jgi:hypothetical protein